MLLIDHFKSFYWNAWRSLGDSNPCFRRERATSWAARRREPRSEIDAMALARKRISSPSFRGAGLSPRARNLYSQCTTVNCGDRLADPVIMDSGLLASLGP